MGGGLICQVKDKSESTVLRLRALLRRAVWPWAETEARGVAGAFPNALRLPAPVASGIYVAAAPPECHTKGPVPVFNS